ncbi:hypothetical protein ACQI4E_28415 [Streptomyces sp. CA-252508]|uniref:hypothetical protein n=1 Tax=Streptomyces sp. CA-252508 TaxID=3418946 RepID=UPI003D923E6D
MRRIAAVVLGTVAFLGSGALSSTAVAVPDPVATVECATASVTDLTTLVDPASPALPSEVPGVACLAV